MNFEKAFKNGNFWVNIASIIVGGFFTVFALTSPCCESRIIGYVLTLAYLVALALTYEK